jgi:hypothetical protein
MAILLSLPSIHMNISIEHAHNYGTAISQEFINIYNYFQLNIEELINVFNSIYPNNQIIGNENLNENLNEKYIIDKLYAISNETLMNLNDINKNKINALKKKSIDSLQKSSVCDLLKKLSPNTKEIIITVLNNKFEKIKNEIKTDKMEVVDLSKYLKYKNKYINLKKKLTENIQQ